MKAWYVGWVIFFALMAVSTAGCVLLVPSQFWSVALIMGFAICWHSALLPWEIYLLSPKLTIEQRAKKRARVEHARSPRTEEDPS